MTQGAIYCGKLSIGFQDLPTQFTTPHNSGMSLKDSPVGDDRCQKAT